MTEPKEWTPCAGCQRLRSALTNGLCTDCTEKGVKTRQRPKAVVHAAPVPAPVPDPVVVEALDEIASCDTCHDNPGDGTCCLDAPADPEYFGITDPSPTTTPTPKQKPVKRRWWKPRHR